MLHNIAASLVAPLLTGFTLLRNLTYARSEVGDFTHFGNVEVRAKCGLLKV